MKSKADIVVIGAGIMGSSLTYFLSKMGREVVVLERDEICSGTSSSTAAWLWPSDEQPEVYGRLAKDAYDMYEDLIKELDADIELTINSSLDMAYTDEDLKYYEELCAYDTKLGYECKVLTPEELYKEEPLLAPGLKGGYIVKSDGHLNPFLLVNAYIQAAKKLGAEVNTFTKVEGFEMTGNHIDKVITNRGTIEANLVICAAGIYSRDIAKMLGIDAHVYPEKGHCLVSEKMPKILNHMVSGARQSKSGNIVFGFNQIPMELESQDRRALIEGLNIAAFEAVRDFPALKNINIIRSYAGIRCRPDDKLPILGPTEIIDNFWFHLMHNAFACNPAASSRIAEVVCGKRSMDTLKAFAYTRFLKTDENREDE